MPSVGEVKAGIDAGNSLINDSQGFNVRTADDAGILPLEAVSNDFDELSSRLSTLADRVAGWPISIAQIKRGEADGQYSHSMAGGMDHPLVQATFSALGEKGERLTDAGGFQTSLREKLLALGGAAAELARLVRDEAIPMRDSVKERVTEANILGDTVKEKATDYRSIL